MNHGPVFGFDFEMFPVIETVAERIFLNYNQSQYSHLTLDKKIDSFPSTDIFEIIMWRLLGLKEGVLAKAIRIVISL
jgi:hypothetical protein